MLDTTLPTLPAGLTIEPLHEVAARSPRFLVRCNGRSFVVSESTRALIEAVRDGDAAGSWDAVYERVVRSGGTVERGEFEATALRALTPVVDAAQAPFAPRRTPFVVHAAVLSRKASHGITSALAFCYARWFAIPALLAFVALAVFALPRVLFYSSFALTPVDLIELVAAVVASSLVHELGHAAAARRFGIEHGEIGAGVYLFYPMFYIDVDDLWRARPAQRVIVNLGGIYFQAVTLIPVLALLLFADVPDFVYTFVWLTLLMMVQNLNPTFKLDGYWVLTDAAGLTNLHRRAFEALRAPRRFLDARIPRVQRAALGAYFALVAGYVAFIVFTIGRVVETFGPIVVPYAQDAFDQISVGFALGDGDLAQGGAGALVVGALAAAVVIVPVAVLLRRAVAARARRV